MPVFSHFQFCLVLENQLSPTHTYIYIYKLQEKQKSFHNVVKKHHQKFLTKSNRPEVFCKKGALKNFAKFTGKHLCQSPFFSEVTGLRSATLLKNSLCHGCFPVNFEKFLRAPFLEEHLRWLLMVY